MPRSELFRLFQAHWLGAHAGDHRWRAEPAAHECRALLEAQRYYRLHQSLDRLRVVDPARYRACLLGLARWHAPARLLDWWVFEAGHRASPWLVRGMHGVLAAQRGFGPERGIGAGSIAACLAHLERAEADLATAAQRDASDPEPFVWLLRSALSAGLDEAEIEGRFRRGLAAHPDCMPAHVERLRSLGGADRRDALRALAFAREVSDAAPRASPLHALVAQAFIEGWAWRLYTHSPEDADRLMQGTEVLAELRVAALRAAGSEAGPDGSCVAGLFATAFYLAGEWEAAGRAIRDVGPAPEAYPWGYLAGPLQAQGDTPRIVEGVRSEIEGRRKSGRRLHKHGA